MAGDDKKIERSSELTNFALWGAVGPHRGPRGGQGAPFPLLFPHHNLILMMMKSHLRPPYVSPVDPLVTTPVNSENPQLAPEPCQTRRTAADSSRIEGNTKEK